MQTFSSARRRTLSRRPGLADLLAGKATFGDVIRRDLSSGLDVIPAGGEPLGDGLAEALAALTASYGCVVLHASDWRSPPARLAVDFVDALVLAAPTLLLPRLVEEAREALGDGAKNPPLRRHAPASRAAESRLTTPVVSSAGVAEGDG